LHGCARWSFFLGGLVGEGAAVGESAIVTVGVGTLVGSRVGIRVGKRGGIVASASSLTLYLLARPASGSLYVSWTLPRRIEPHATDG